MVTCNQEVGHAIVVLQQGERLYNRGGFSVDMSVNLSPADGPAGTPITVEVRLSAGGRSPFHRVDLGGGRRVAPD